MAEILDVSELEQPPEIGRMYRVPCVRVASGFYAGLFLPALGELHEDRDLGISNYHFHFDWRFIADTLMRRLRRRGYIPVVSLILSPDAKPQHKTLLRKCVRAAPDFPSHAPWMARLEAEYLHARLLPGMVCPHRGMSLASQPVEDGCVTCPLHGLRWDVVTGALAPRALPLLEAETLRYQRRLAERRSR